MHFFHMCPFLHRKFHNVSQKLLSWWDLLASFCDYNSLASFSQLINFRNKLKLDGSLGLFSLIPLNFCVCVCVCTCARACTHVCLVAQLCQTLCNPMDCSPPVSSVHGILQAGILEYVAISFSMRSSQPRNGTRVSFIAGGFFTVWGTRETLFKPGYI